MLKVMGYCKHLICTSLSIFSVGNWFCVAYKSWLFVPTAGLDSGIWMTTYFTAGVIISKVDDYYFKT